MKFYHDNTYLDLIRNILENGVQKGDRTGTGTISTFAQQMRFDLTGGAIPLLTTKKMHTKSIIHELLWFLAGDTNIKYLNDNGVRIWNEWADEAGELGPVYGKQWRDWTSTRWNRLDGAFGDEDVAVTHHVDQIAQIIEQLRNNPNDRRIIVSAWNVGELDKMALPPCHAFFQFWSCELTLEERRNILDELPPEQKFYPKQDESVEDHYDRCGIPRRALKCHLYQRSCDVGLGVPFNIAQYSFLVHMIAQVTNHAATEFIWTGGDTHIYNNHVEQLKGQLEIEPYPSPKLHLNPDISEINDFRFEDFEIVNYESHPTIKMDVSV